MAIQHVELLSQQIHGPKQEDQSAEALVDAIKKRILKKTDEKRDEHKKEISTRAQVGEHTAGFAALKNGSGGAVAAQAAHTIDTPMYHGTSIDAQNGFLAQTQKDPQSGFSAASSFRTISSDKRSEMALASTEAKSTVLNECVNQHKNPDRFGKVFKTIAEDFIPTFSKPFDSKVKDKALRYGVKNPQTDGQKLLYKTLGSGMGEQVSKAAQEAVLAIANRDDPDQPDLLNNAAKLLNSKDIIKQAGQDKSLTQNLSQALVLLNREGGSGRAAEEFEKLLTHAKFSNMAPEQRDKMLQCYGKYGVSEFGQYRDPVLNSLGDLRKTKQKDRALTQLLRNRAELNQESLETCLERAGQREFVMPVFNFPRDSEGHAQADDKTLAPMLSQLQLHSKRIEKENKNIVKAYEQAANLADLKETSSFKTFAPLLAQYPRANELIEAGADKEDIVAALTQDPNNPMPARLANFVADKQMDYNDNIKKGMEIYRKKQRELRHTRGQPARVRERKPVDVAAYKTSFTLPSVVEQDGKVTTVSLTQILRTHVSAQKNAVVTHSLSAQKTAPVLANQAQQNTTQTTAKTSAGGQVKGWGNMQIKIGMDAETQRMRVANGEAVKTPKKAVEGPQISVGKATGTLSTGQTLVKEGASLRPLSELIAQGIAWKNLSFEECLVYKNLGFNAQMFATLPTTSPILPQKCFKTYQDLQEYEQKSVLLAGFAQASWDAFVAQLKQIKAPQKSRINVHNVAMKGQA